MKPFMAAFMAALLLLCSNASPRVQTWPKGLWPADWPGELEPFRDEAITYQYMTLNRGTIYQITFDSRDEFESIWPALLKVKSKGAPVEILPIGWPENFFGDKSLDASEPRARIIAPPSGIAGQPPMRDDAGNVISSERVRLISLKLAGEELTEDQAAALDADSIVGGLTLDPELLEAQRSSGWFLEFGPEWPEHIRDENGYLPECVHAVGEPGSLKWAVGEREGGGCTQCRIQLQLIVDGDIIDLSRIQFPADTPIIDNRTIKDPPPRIAAE